MILQVAVLNNLKVGGLLIPFVYPLFLLQFPKNTPRWALLVTGFLLGSLVDIYLHSYGSHAFSLTFIAYLRPFILDAIAPQDSSFESAEPSVYNLGFQRFVTYAGILLLIHHFVVFSIDELQWKAPLFFLGQVIFSTVLSLILSFTIQYVFNNKTL